MEILNKDNWYLGLGLGLLLPLVIFALVLMILSPWGYVQGLTYLPNPKIPPLVAVFSNLFPLRYYLVNKKFDLTGRGILIVTFVLAMLMFVVYF